MNENAYAGVGLEANAKPRFSPDAIGANTGGLAERKVFQGDRRLYAKQLTIIGVVVVIALVAFGYYWLEERNPRFYLFMCGMAVAILTVRFFSMMGLNGPPAVTFDTGGITLQRGKKTTEISWSELRSIRNEVIRGGQLWEIAWAGGKFDYFIDGLTSAKKAELKNTIGNIQLPHVEIRLDHYDTV